MFKPTDRDCGWSQSTTGDARHSVLAAVLLIATAIVPAYAELPAGVVNTQNPNDVPLTPEETLERITVPEGFHVTLFASEPDIRRPIAFDFDNRGRLWVVENYSHPEWDEQRRVDRVVILEDADNDGRFDTRKVFWDEGRYLTGIAYGFGGVFLCDTPELVFVPDTDSDDKPDGPPQVLLDGWSRQSLHNVPNNLTWAPDGWLWGCVGVGAESRVGPPGTPDDQRHTISRGIWRFHPIERRFQVLAHGCVNPWGVDFDDHGDAFNTNTVTAHLWHIVPGAYFERRKHERDNPFAYGRIQSIADHLHWGGGDWGSSRGGEGKHSAAGGGHAHTAAMIYLGDNFPEKYRGGFFTGNLHGNRINHDRLTPRRSTYVGTHEADLLTCSDVWFRPLGMKYGPDGGVFVSDWHDFGECHDSDGSHRSSGRIYKITYGTPALEPFDINQFSDERLAGLMHHANEWYVRHARRVLQERALQGRHMDAAEKLLRTMMRGEDVRLRLRAIWALNAMNRLSEGDLLSLLEDPSEHVRWWGVRLLADRRSNHRTALVELARRETSARVRLEIAAAAPYVGGPEFSGVVAIASELLQHSEDRDDPVIPLMIWYSTAPIVPELGPEALAMHTSIETFRRFAARRLVEHDPALAADVVRVASEASPPAQLAILEGLLDAIEQGTRASAPAGWETLYEVLRRDGSTAVHSVAMRLALAFGDEELVTELRGELLDRSASERDRRAALQSLLAVEGGATTALLHGLVHNSEARLRLDAIGALARLGDSETDSLLMNVYPELDAEARRSAVEAMVTRRASVQLLLDGLATKKVQRRDVSAYALRQLRSFQDSEIRAQVEQHFGQPLTEAKAEKLRQYKELLTPEYLQNADIAKGRAVFTQSCAVCHTLFGVGETIGPDLTGSQRLDVDYVLQNLVDPSAIVDEAYQLTTVITDDGRVHTGFLVAQNDYELSLRTVTGLVTFATEQIELIQTTPTSMMPDGLLDTVSSEELRDLVGYLASPLHAE